MPNTRTRLQPNTVTKLYGCRTLPSTRRTAAAHTSVSNNYVGTPVNVYTNCFGEPSATLPRASARLRRNSFAYAELPPRFRQASAHLFPRHRWQRLLKSFIRGLFEHDIHMTGAKYSVTRRSFGLCLRLLLREPCGILAGPGRDNVACGLSCGNLAGTLRDSRVTQNGYERKRNM